MTELDEQGLGLNREQMLAAVYGARVASCIAHEVEIRARTPGANAVFSDETYDLIHQSGLYYARRMSEAIDRRLKQKGRVS